MTLTAPQRPSHVQGIPVQRALWCSLHQHIQLSIFHYATIPAAAMLGATNKESRYMFLELVRKRVERLLRSFGLPPTTTLSMLGDAKAVISGSAVLSIIVPGVFTPRDIDIYVAQENVGIVEHFLRNQVGLGSYWFSRSRGFHQYYTGRQTGISESKYYYNPIAHRIINVVVTKTRVSTTPIFVFNSASVMNYITTNTLVCAYPRMTGDRAGLANTHLLREKRKTERWYEKYRNRGFTELDTADEWDPDHLCFRSGYCGSFTRTVNDGWTMRISFRTHAQEAPEVVDGGTTWKLACRSVCGYPYHYPRAGYAESSHGDRLVNIIVLPPSQS